MRPGALLFDMDGVLCDTSRSYRETIRKTAAEYGVKVSRDDVQAAKEAGDANNDWEVTRRFLRRQGVDVALEEVTRRFEEIYQGTPDRPGLRTEDRRLAARLPLAVVTGRPRSDAVRFLEEHDLVDLFAAVVTMEDGPAKPDPVPVRLALDRLDVREAWMIGDTPDDVRAARGAGVVPIGVVAPGDSSEMSEVLLCSGAARVLGDLTDLEDMLP